MNDNTINNDMTMGGAAGTLLAGRYRVVRQLGQGGMGSVWLAEDTTLDNRQVAIKTLPSVLLSNKRAYQQIKSEALLSLKLIHSNIAPIRSFEENNGNPFLVEDYICGKNLDACLAEWGTLSEEETIALLKPVAEAIDYAHSAKVVHRDIKPANIMIREDGTPFVLDFGIAREMQETMTKVTGKLSSGTLMYMSPEQLKGAAPAPSQDVYSFAAMAYECLCGHPPFHRGQIEYQIVNETPEPLPFDSALSRKIMSALSKSPDERPVSCLSILEVGLSTAKKEAADEKATASAAKSTVVKQSMAHRMFGKPFSRTVAFLIVLLVLALFQGGSVTRQWIFALFEKTDDTKSSVTRGEPAEIRGRTVGDTKTITLPGGATMEMVWCPPSSFIMGSPTNEVDRGSDETQRKVTLARGFWMGKYEVTQKQWESVMGVNPSHFKGADRPVEQVSWDDCQLFVRKVNVSGLLTVSLPTESQWEYGCRAGTTTPYSFGSSLNGDKANCNGNYPCGTTFTGRYRRETASVGSYAPNAWGLYDMHGNVWEWCADGRGYLSSATEGSEGQSLDEGRVCRGGGWFSEAHFCRSAARYMNSPGVRLNNLGFRLVCCGENESVKKQQDISSVKCQVCNGSGKVEKTEVCPPEATRICFHCNGSRKVCDQCDGQGITIGTTSRGRMNVKCWRCKGTGHEVCDVCNGVGTYAGTCTRCNGTGTARRKVKCENCDGKGVVNGD